MRTGLVALVGQQSDVHNSIKARCCGSKFTALVRLHLASGGRARLSASRARGQSGPGLAALRRETRTIPIVFVQVGVSQTLGD